MAVRKKGRMKKIRIINKDFTNFLKSRDGAFTDYLTKLPNRRGMYEHYEGLRKDSFVTVYFLDIDDFKEVNDVYGHSGPAVELLKEFGLCAENIAEQVRKALK